MNGCMTFRPVYAPHTTIKSSFRSEVLSRDWGWGFLAATSPLDADRHADSMSDLCLPLSSRNPTVYALNAGHNWVENGCFVLLQWLTAGCRIVGVRFGSKCTVPASFYTEFILFVSSVSD